jgi:hypothetical protein
MEEQEARADLWQVGSEDGVWGEINSKLVFDS